MTEVVVEPPDGACFAATAYEAGDAEPHRLAFVKDVGEDDSAALLNETKAHHYIRTVLPRITTKPADGSLNVLGVVYADSPLLGPTDADSKQLSAVSVAVTGVATIVDEAFANKQDYTAGKRLHVQVQGGHVRFCTTATPAAESGWRNVGLVLEVGAQNDLRVLLTL